MLESTKLLLGLLLLQLLWLLGLCRLNVQFTGTATIVGVLRIREESWNHIRPAFCQPILVGVLLHRRGDAPNEFGRWDRDKRLLRLQALLRRQIKIVLRFDVLFELIEYRIV